MTNLAAARSITALVAILAALCADFAALAMGYMKGAQSGMGFTIVDMLVIPLILAFFAAPPLFAAGMATRSRSWKSFAVAFVIVALLATALVVMRCAPWDYTYWKAHNSDANFQIWIAQIFFSWPLVAIGGLVWL